MLTLFIIIYSNANFIYLFPGTNHRLDDPNNGNFLGILELISHYDSTLREHLDNIRLSQQEGKRMQVHHLSPLIQNEFINICAQHVISVILKKDITPSLLMLLLILVTLSKIHLFCGT